MRGLINEANSDILWVMQERRSPGEESLDELLSREPSGPDFTQPTIEYMEAIVQKSLPHFRDTLINQFGEELSVQITEQINLINSEAKMVPLQPDFIKSGNVFQYRFKHGVRPFKSLLYAASSVSPLFTASDYGFALYPDHTKQFGGDSHEQWWIDDHFAASF